MVRPVTKSTGTLLFFSLILSKCSSVPPHIRICHQSLLISQPPLQLTKAVPVKLGRQGMALFVNVILAEGTAHLPLEHGGEVLLEAPGHGTPHGKQQWHRVVFESWTLNIWLNLTICLFNMSSFLMFFFLILEILNVALFILCFTVCLNSSLV